MIHKIAVWVLANYVFNDIQAHNFWSDPAYENDIKALLKVGYIKEKELEELRKQKATG